MGEPFVSIIIPTHNGSKTLIKVLPAVFEQKTSFPFEVLMVDSESTDGTPQLVQQFNVRFFSIRKKDFNHGATRQWASEKARGEFVVFLTQDATPANSYWLSSLVDPVVPQEKIIGAYSRQVPYPDCHPIDAEGILQWFGPERKIYHWNGIDWESLSPMERRLSANFDDVSSCIWREALLQFPFQALPFAEDLEWAKRVLKTGMKLVYEPASVVQHSHNRSPIYEFKRRYIDHKMNKAFYGIELFKNWGEVSKGILHEWKQNYKKVQGYKGEPMEKYPLLIHRGAVTVSQVLGTYLGAHSTKYGHSLKLTPLERWLTRGI